MNTYFDAKVRKLLIVTLSVLILFLVVESIAALADIGIRKESVMPSNVISVRAEGEAVATPDIATFSFTVRETAKDAASVQQAMSDKANKAIAYLKENGIEDKDIKTENYTTNPKYDYQGGVCNGGICTPSKQILSGYEASESVSVKVRDTAKAGTLLTGIAGLSVGEVSSLSFTIDDTDALKAKAKADAIKKAKADAEATAKNLGVHLGKIVGFYEESDGDLYRSASVAPTMMKAEGFAGNVAPDLEKGEQKVTSAVSITYEVK